jgi:phage-related protein
VTAPIEHLQDALQLEAETVIDLWELRLKNSNVIAHFWNGVERTWQGNLYQGLACQLSGEARSTDNKNNRPNLTIVNPENIFGAFAAAGDFDLATVIRKRVLASHFVNDANIFQQRVWLVGRPASVRNSVITLELRAPTDMPVWHTPCRTYNPPEYPFVVL